jgi:S-DNA-T family DNA segregation ATPase FtsK/SpoIIIE
MTLRDSAPSRISYRLASLDESEAFLHVGGAESLSIAGDMLYMPSCKQSARVHGPFVSDNEVRAVANHWRGQSTPDYISGVTDEPEDGGFALDVQPAEDVSPAAALYRKTVEVVASSQKASTSYVQRQLRNGYYSAAGLIERMEKNGKAGAPDHVGRREVLIDRDSAFIDTRLQWPSRRSAP